MNEALRPYSPFDVPWPASDNEVKKSDTSTSPAGEQASAAVVRVFEPAVQGSHDTIDRAADMAAPVVRQLGDSISAAGEALHAKRDQLRLKRDEWVEGARTSVRSHPLAFVAAAVAVGAVIARVTR